MNPDGGSYLAQIVAAQKKGQARGVVSICSSNDHVLDACAARAAREGSTLLVESTCNQVNQFGGYSGMRPARFRDYAGRIADRRGLPPERLILGGDHLGPGPWKQKMASTALAHARRLVQDCVAAGYQKIHLDASISCADDDPGQPLPKEVSAARTAELCQVAEEAWQAQGAGAQAPCYVIGTEVPSPGGTTAAEAEPAVTSAADAEETLELTRRAFLGRGLHSAWQRVLALVVQPGVEFGDACIHPYQPQPAAALSAFIETRDHLVYEAHSTDYQTKEALKAMVRDHFAILKVGPALTFAFREALFALALIEEAWLGSAPDLKRSNLVPLVDEVMIRQPEHWQNYYRGTQSELSFARKYSRSDRVRYYWPCPVLQAAIERLLGNLERRPPPLSLVSQFLPNQYAQLRAGTLANRPHELIRSKIEGVLKDYDYAVAWERRNSDDHDSR